MLYRLLLMVIGLTLCHCQMGTLREDPPFCLDKSKCACSPDVNDSRRKIMSCSDIGNISSQLSTGLMPAADVVAELRIERSYTPTLATTTFEFSDFVALRLLAVDMCGVEHIDDGALDPLADTLTALSLRNNELRTLDVNVFKRLEKLTSLSLAQNSIKHLPARVFVYLTNLETLDLSKNLLEELPDGMLQYLFNLKVLRVSDNSLKRIGPAFFGTLRNLVDVDLSWNFIQSIDARCLDLVPKLERMNISNNEVTTLSKELIDHYVRQPNRQTPLSFDFDSNPITCDARLVSFIGEYQLGKANNRITLCRDNMRSKCGPKCAAPIAFRGSFIQAIEPQSLMPSTTTQLPTPETTVLPEKSTKIPSPQRDTTKTLLQNGVPVPNSSKGNENEPRRTNDMPFIVAVVVSTFGGTILLILIACLCCCRVKNEGKRLSCERGSICERFNTGKPRKSPRHGKNYRRKRLSSGTASTNAKTPEDDREHIHTISGNHHFSINTNGVGFHVDEMGARRDGLLAVDASPDDVARRAASNPSSAGKTGANGYDGPLGSASTDSGHGCSGHDASDDITCSNSCTNSSEPDEWAQTQALSSGVPHAVVKQHQQQQDSPRKPTGGRITIYRPQSAAIHGSKTLPGPLPPPPAMLLPRTDRDGDMPLCDVASPLKTITPVFAGGSMDHLATYANSDVNDKRTYSQRQATTKRMAILPRYTGHRASIAHGSNTSSHHPPHDQQQFQAVHSQHIYSLLKQGGLLAETRAEDLERPAAYLPGVGSRQSADIFQTAQHRRQHAPEEAATAQWLIRPASGGNTLDSEVQRHFRAAALADMPMPMPTPAESASTNTRTAFESPMLDETSRKNSCVVDPVTGRRPETFV